MAMAEDELEQMGALSQAELDALIAGASPGKDAEEEMAFGGSDEMTLEADPLPTAAGLVDLPEFDLPPGRSSALEMSTAEDGLGRVRDIPLEVTVELGRTRLLIRDILDLSSGSIIELDKIAGEPVDLFANGLLIGRGEVIVIDDNFGVRVTEIITAAARNGSERDVHALAA